MTLCSGVTRSGDRCKMPALRNAEYCFTHDPASSVSRAIARKRGGKHRTTPHGAASIPTEIRSIEDATGILTYVLAELGPHDNSLARVKVFLQLFDSYCRSIEIGEFETRLSKLENSRFSWHIGPN